MTPNDFPPICLRTCSSLPIAISKATERFLAEDEPFAMPEAFCFGSPISRFLGEGTIGDVGAVRIAARGGQIHKIEVCLSDLSANLPASLQRIRFDSDGASARIGVEITNGLRFIRP